jgi:hypothetical protein
MISRDLLIHLIEACHLYDITDILITSNQEHYDMVQKLYNESLVIARVIEPTPYSWWIIGFNVVISSFVLQAKYQLKTLFVDKEYLKQEMARLGKTDEETFLKTSQDILNIYGYLPYLQIVQFLMSLKNQLYRSKTFYEIYESKLITYILEQQAQGNLSEEVINLIVNLT